MDSEILKLIHEWIINKFPNHDIQLKLNPTFEYIPSFISLIYRNKFVEMFINDESESSSEILLGGIFDIRHKPMKFIQNFSIELNSPNFLHEWKSTCQESTNRLASGSAKSELPRASVCESLPRRSASVPPTSHTSNREPLIHRPQNGSRQWPSCSGRMRMK